MHTHHLNIATFLIYSYNSDLLFFQAPDLQHDNKCLLNVH